MAQTPLAATVWLMLQLAVWSCTSERASAAEQVLHAYPQQAFAAQQCLLLLRRRCVPPPVCSII